MPRKSFRATFLAIPVLGYSARVAAGIVRGPRIHQAFRADVANVRTELHKMVLTLTEQQQQNAKLLHELTTKVDSLQSTQDDLRQNMEHVLSRTSQTAQTTESSPNVRELFADDHTLDVFYTNFEDKFRGTEDLIRSRLVEYLPLFTESSVEFKKKPVLDIGSGRGEFLTLLKDNHIYGIGLDINHDMVKRAREKDLNVSQGDALSFLQKQKTQSLGAITGFHIVEHIPFTDLLKIFATAHTALTVNGFVIFETPNPENVTVGSCSFYMDPSHLHPIPPALLAFALETAGFRKVEIRRTHAPEVPESAKDLPPEVIDRLFGPMDYAVVGYK